jgi:hypothetical protein
VSNGSHNQKSFSPYFFTFAVQTMGRTSYIGFGKFECIANKVVHELPKLEGNNFHLTIAFYFYAGMGFCS